MNTSSAAQTNFLAVSAGAGTLLPPTGTTGSRGSNTNRWCWNGVSGCFPFLRSSRKDIGLPQEMVKLYMTNQQPQRETPMTMLLSPPAVHERPGQPLQRHDSVLGHHPGGLADEYYCPVSSAVRPRLKKVSYLLAEIPLTEAGVHDLLKRLGPAEPSTIPQEHKSGLGFTTVLGPVFVPLGEQISSFAMALLINTLAFPLTQAETMSAPMPRLLLESMLPPNDDRVGGWAEDTIEELQDIGIPVVQPGKRRMIISDASSMDVRIHGDNQGDGVPKANHSWTLSDLFPGDGENSDENDDKVPMARPTTVRRLLSDCSSSDSIGMAQPASHHRPISDGSSTFTLPMARPASRRRALSNCFSVGSKSSYSTYDSDSDTESLAEIPLADRSDSPIFPTYPYRFKPLAANEQDVWIEMYAGRREGPASVAVVSEATTCKSMTAELCWAFDSEEKDDEVEDEGVISKRDSYSVYESCGRSSEDVQRSESLDTYYQQADTSVDPGWAEDQIWSALLFAGEHQACLMRFAGYWDDPDEESFDQSLFADFDADFSDEAVEIPQPLPEM